MDTPPPTIRIGSLSLTLDEAEETLRAIREGKIDAVVVDGSSGSEVYTFRDPSHPFRLLVEEMGEGAALTTWDGTISYHNPCLGRMVGATGPVTPLAFEHLVAPAYREPFRALLERARSGPTAHGNVELLGTDGRTIPVKISATPARLLDQDVLCMVVIDLTEQRRQEELYHSARLEIEARDRLLSIAAHELRNPLGVLQMQTHLLIEELSGAAGQPVTAEMRTKLDRVHAQERRLGELVEKLLDVGSIGAGRLRLAREVVDLAEVVRGVVERSNEQIERSGSTLSMDLEPVYGRFDRVRMEQVVGNLLSNAVKYGLGKPIRISLARGAFMARLTVEDRGRGIPAEARERIFRPYERVSTSDRVPGLGIGLFVTAEIVKAHGGSIRVLGNPDGGSSFVVEVPFDS